jgi:hypothetical protein
MICQHVEDLAYMVGEFGDICLAGGTLLREMGTRPKRVRDIFAASHAGLTMTEGDDPPMGPL